jgi:hypothetical protein
MELALCGGISHDVGLSARVLLVIDEMAIQSQASSLTHLHSSQRNIVSQVSLRPRLKLVSSTPCAPRRQVSRRDAPALAG